MTSTSFAISRTFQAPKSLVWKALSEGNAMAQWWGPKGFSTDVRRFEFEPGGIFHYKLESHGGQVMWGRFEYKEIEPMDRLVFLSGFSDETGGLVRAPFFDGVWPLEVLDTITLVEEGDRTTLTLTAVPVNASAAEEASFLNEFKGMQAGFGGTFDQLDAYLSREPSQ
jgi:uncharacterized protein YndB with AHSA1/START domain